MKPDIKHHFRDCSDGRCNKCNKSLQSYAYKDTQTGFFNLCLSCSDSQETEKVNRLPIYKINGKFYFLDKRLSEYRNVKNPFDVLRFDGVSLDMLEKPTDKDKAIWECAI